MIAEAGKILRTIDAKGETTFRGRVLRLQTDLATGKDRAILPVTLDGRLRTIRVDVPDPFRSVVLSAFQSRQKLDVQVVALNVGRSSSPSRRASGTSREMGRVPIDFSAL